MRKMSIGDLHDLLEVIEQNRKTIPIGKALISGNENLIDTMKQQNWTGEYHYSKMLKNNETFIVDTGYSFKVHY